MANAITIDKYYRCSTAKEIGRPTHSGNFERRSRIIIRSSHLRSTVDSVYTGVGYTGMRVIPDVDHYSFNFNMEIPESLVLMDSGSFSHSFLSTPV